MRNAGLLCLLALAGCGGGDSRVAALEARLAKLESRQEVSPQDVVRAERFELVDKSGKVLAIIGADNGQTAIMFASGSSTFAKLGVEGGGAFLALRNEKKESAVLLMNEAIAPILAINDAQEKPRITLSINHENFANVRVDRASGKGGMALLESNVIETDVTGDIIWAAKR